MKKLILVLLMASACGGSDDTTQTSSGTTESTPTVETCETPQNVVGIWVSASSEKLSINSACTWSSDICSTSGTMTKIRNPETTSEGTFYHYYITVSTQVNALAGCLPLGTHTCTIGYKAASDNASGSDIASLICSVNGNIANQITESYSKL